MRSHYKSRHKKCNYCERPFKDVSKFNSMTHCSKLCVKNTATCRRHDISNYEHQKLMTIDTCEICNNKFKSRRDKCIDHCHESLRVRGVLCTKCNTSLGGLGDNINGLRSALNYLQRDFIIDSTT
jgi:hypothetical protein